MKTNFIGIIGLFIPIFDLNTHALEKWGIFVGYLILIVQIVAFLIVVYIVYLFSLVFYSSIKFLYPRFREKCIKIKVDKVAVA